MATARPEITGRNASSPLAVTVQRACELSGLGPTSIWAFLKDGRLEPVRVPAFGARLLAIPASSACSPQRPVRSRRRYVAAGGAKGAPRV
jgi:hypothetical protein